MKAAIVNPDGLMDAETIAHLLGVSKRQLNNYVNLKGLPSEGSGTRRTFVWSEVREWYVQYRMQMEMGDGNDGSEEGDFDDETSDSGPAKKEDIRAANLRKTRAEADLKQLQLGKLRGEVISIPDAKVRLDRMMGNLRAKLLAMGPKLASRLEGEPSRTAREAALKEELENLCREISTGAVVDIPVDEPSAIDLEASADRPADMTDAEYIQHLEDMEMLYQTAYEVCHEMHPELHPPFPPELDNAGIQ